MMKKTFAAAVLISACLFAGCANSRTAAVPSLGTAPASTVSETETAAEDTGNPAAGAGGGMDSQAVTTIAPAEEESETEDTTETESVTAEESETTQPETPSETEEESEESETSGENDIGQTALAVVPNYVNVRKGPSVEDEVVGKIYNYCAAYILDEMEEEDGLWYLISSGNVIGYIKAEFFLTGEEADAMREEVGVLTGIVMEEYLRVRSEPDLTNPDNVYTYYQAGTKVFIDELTEDGWAKIKSDDAGFGYVYAECLDIRMEFKTAVTLLEEQEELERKAAAEEAARIAEEELQAALAAEEEEKRLAEEARLATEEAERQAQAAILAQKAAEEAQAQAALLAEQQAQQQAAAQAAQEAQAQRDAEAQAQALAAQQAAAEEAARIAAEAAAQQQAQADAAAQAAAEQAAAQAAAAEAAAANDPAAATRNAVVSYALQWVGHPYVHGGRSLETGTDCSGFTHLVYEKFGYYLDYTPRGQSVQYNRVDVGSIQPGDLLFYANSYSDLGHVALYIGDGQIVHAGTEETGIFVGSAYYRNPVCAVRVIN